MSLDPLDLRLLALLQEDASSPMRSWPSASGCRPRSARGAARGWRRPATSAPTAPTSTPRKLGYGIEAFTRVTLSKHSDATAEDFAHFLEGLGEVLAAHSVAGDADYLLHIRVRSLDELGEFVLKRLLPHPHVHQVRSDIVLKTIKENRGFRIGASAGKPAKKATRASTVATCRDQALRLDAAASGRLGAAAPSHHSHSTPRTQQSRETDETPGQHCRTEHGAHLARPARSAGHEQASRRS